MDYDGRFVGVPRSVKEVRKTDQSHVLVQSETRSQQTQDAQSLKTKIPWTVVKSTSQAFDRFRGLTLDTPVKSRHVVQDPGGLVLCTQDKQSLSIIMINSITETLCMASCTKCP